ncbi:hypothetical protein BC826DRAFT_621383 [Russula brevipes]|nr:hypothetical protein BC826DRAFT_621383 [Russula brevipes]
MNHPNFPVGLSISHSSYPSTHPTALNSLGTDVQGPGSVLSAEAQDRAIAKYGIAGRVWEAAYAMMLYVRNPDAYEFDPRFDLGPRAVAVELGAEVCPLLQVNARGYAGVEVRPLAWGRAAHAQALRDELSLTPISHVICSDLVYFPELLAPLLRSLLHLTTPTRASPAASPQVVLSYKIRSLTKETAFWSAFGLWFTLAPVLVRPRLDDNGARWARFDACGDGDVFVFVARRKPESFAWAVPEDDGALLEGVGARGTPERKGDDGFELFLLMNVDE